MKRIKYIFSPFFFFSLLVIFSISSDLFSTEPEQIAIFYSNDLLGYLEPCG